MRRLPRRLRSLAVTSCLALLPVAAVAQPASAGLSTPVPMNQFEEVTYTFTDDDALFVYVLSDTRGGAVCVVPATLESPEGRSCKSSSVGWATPNTIVGVGSVIQPIQAPPLVPGEYKLMAENSAHEGTALGEVFTVGVCDTCDPSLAQAIVQEWKDRAASVKDQYGTVCAGFALKDLHDQVTAARGKVKDAADRADAYEAGTAGFFATVGGSLGGLGFGFPSVGAAIGAGQEKALEILAELTCTVSAMYSDIVQDPPDPNFATVAQPSYRPIDSLGTAAGDALAAALDRQTGDGEASLHAFERYLGAVGAGDTAGIIRQLNAAADFTFDTADGLVATADALRAHAAELAALPTYDQPIVTTETLPQVLAVRQRVRDSGFTADELAQLTAAGMTTEQIAGIRSHFLTSTAGLQPDVTLPDLIVQQAAATEAEAEGLREFGAHAAVSAARTAARQNTAPVAAFTRTPATGPAPLAVSFDASTSSDSDGTISSYAWQFGDGGTGTDVSPSHTYPSSGSYTVTLTVTDDDGATDTATSSVVVTDPTSNAPPTAAFTHAPLLGPPPLGIAFDASTSSDSDGTIAGYAWEFGDGSSGSGVTTSHAYTAEGTYTVQLTVTDDGGATDSATASVTVGAAPANEPPVADAVASPASGRAPLLTSLSGGLSTDPDGSITSYAWDFGDGTTGDGPTLTHTYATAGPYTATLTITDDDGATATDAVTISVTPPNRPPLALIDADPPAGSAPLTVTFTDATEDPDGDAITSRIWSFWDGSTSDAAVVEKTLTEPGTYYAGLTACDSDSYCDSTYRYVVVDTNTPGNKEPTAVDDEVSQREEKPVDVPVLTNDTDADGDTLSVVAFTQAADGHVTCFPAHCEYVGDAGFVGDDSFTYEVTDGKGGRASAEVTVHVTANSAPVAVDDTLSTGRNQPLAAWSPMANDVDPDGDQLSFVGASQPAHGTVQCDPYSCVYTPATDYVGDDSFTYTIRDDLGATGMATVRISVAANRPPTPTPDHASLFARVAALDVLANDTDPDLEQLLTLVSSTQPEHGTVTCSALGACLYKATDGYAGSDRFEYTVEDAAGARATSYADVQPTGVTIPTVEAVEDRLTVEEDTPGTVDVLANDAADGLTVTDVGEPAHGTVSCTPAGLCTYTPDAGFSGFDGFPYRISGDAGSADGAVRVAVVPAGAGFTATPQGRSTALLDPSGTVQMGGSADWSVHVEAVPEGLPQELAEALDPPSVTATPAGAQSPVAGSVRTAKGWTVAVQTDGSLVASAGPGALLGSSSETPLPPPLPPISQGTGGDGHVPILVGSKVFAFFHHQYPTKVSCVDRTTGQLCPGYPRQLTLGAGDAPGKGVVLGSRIWVVLGPAPGGTQTSSYGVACYDTATGDLCGWTIVERQVTSSGIPGTVPVLSGGKLWLATDSGTVHCVDPADGSLCGAVQTGEEDLGDYVDAVGHGSRVFVVGDTAGLTCVDTVTRALCSGWPAHQPALGGYNAVLQHDPAGAVQGVCVAIGSVLRCWPLAGGEPTDHGGWKGNHSVYDFNAEAETGSRTFVGALGRPGLGCWDWATMAPCEGPAFDTDGWVPVDAAGETLPSAYGATWDGSCVVGVGDPGQVFTMSVSGISPCTSLSSGARKVIDLRDQRCGDGVGAAQWLRVDVLDADVDAEFTSLTVVVRDATTDEVLLEQELVGSGSSVDLSGIDPDAHPALVVEGSAISVDGGPAWVDGRPPRVRLGWDADPAQLCLRTTVALVECPDQPAPVSLSALLDGVTTKAELDVTGAPGDCVPEPTQPAATADVLVVAEDTGGVVNVLANDSGGDFGALSVTGVAVPPLHGTAVVAAGGISYAPAPDYSGPDSFRYTASAGGVQVSAQVTVTVTPVNDAPVLTPPSPATVQYSDAVAPVTVHVTDVDTPVSGLTVTATGLPAGLVLGALSAQGDATITGVATAPADAYPVSFGVTDGTATGTGSVTVTVIREDALADVTSPASLPRGVVPLTASLSQADDGSPGDITRARLWFDVRPAADPTAAPLSVGPLQPAADGTVSTTAPLPAGSWSVTVRFDGFNRYFTGPADTTSLVTLDRPPVLTVPASATVQYSDAPTAMYVEASDPDDVPSALTLTAVGLPAGLVLGALDSSGRAPVTGTVIAPAGDHPVVVTLRDGTTQRTDAFVVRVLREDATVVAVTPGTAVPGTVPLSATVTQAADGAAGDLALAQVFFDITPATDPLAAPVVVGPLAASATGEVSASVQLGEGIWDVTARLDPASSWWVGPAGTAVVTVAAPPPVMSAGACTGGGWVGASGQRETFGFTVRSRGRAVTGHLVHTWRTAEGLWRARTTALSDLQVDQQRGTCAFRGGAVVSPPRGAGIAGTFQVHLTDAGRTDDRYEITVRGSGGVIHRSSPDLLGGGNVVVHKLTGGGWLDLVKR